MGNKRRNTGNWEGPRSTKLVTALLAFLIGCVLSCSNAAFANIANTATAAGTYAGSTTTSLPSSACVPVAAPKPAIGILKTAGAVVDTNANGIQDVNDTISYSFTVSNLGNVTLSAVSLTDAKIPNITCLATTLDPGVSTTCTSALPYKLTLVDVNAGFVSNQATAAGTPPTGAAVTDLSDPTVAGTGAGKDNPTVVPLTQTPKIGLVKAAGTVADTNSNGITDVGDKITYSFAVSNLGNVTLNPVSVVDPKLPNITCAATSLAPAATTTCASALPYTLVQLDIDAGLVSNQATASGTPPTGPAVTDLSDPATPGITNNAPTVTNLAPTPKIGLVKSAGTIVDSNSNGHLDAGDTIAYTFVVRNIGNVTLHGIAVTDSKVSPITCPLTTLAPAQSTTCTAPAYTILQTDIDAGQVSNTATASGLSPTNGLTTDVSDPTVSGPAGNAPTLTLLTPTAGLGIVKTAGPIVDANGNGVVDVNDTIAYTFTVMNTGYVTLTAIAVTDPKVTGIACLATSLSPGLSTTCTGAVYKLTQIDIDAGKVTNQATATGKPPTGPVVSDLSDEATPGPGIGNDDPTLTSVPQNPVIGLVKTAGTVVDVNGNGITDLGDKINYAFTVSNLGNVTLNPINVTDAKLTGISCISTSLAPGATTTCSAAPYSIVQADINAGKVSNTATASGKPPIGPNVTDQSDPVTPGPTSNTPTDTFLVATPAIGLVKVSSGAVDFNGNGMIDAGDRITYTFTVSNLGNVTLNAISIADAGITNIVCAATSLLPTKTTTCTADPYVITLADMNAGKASNMATVSGTPPTGPAVTDMSDPTTAGSAAQAPTLTNLPPKPSLTLVKTQNLVGPVNIGGVINYTFTVKNTGNVTLNSITLADAGATITSAGPIPSLLPGATDAVTFQANHVVTGADILAGFYNNTATVTGKPAPVGLADVTASNNVSTPLGLTTSMTLTKSGALANGTAVPPKAGDIVNYTFIVTNTGTSPLHNVTVTDPPINLGSLTTTQRVVALLQGASEPVDDFATAAITPIGNRVYHSGAVEAAQRMARADRVPQVAVQLHASRSLVRMSGTTPTLAAGDKIGFLFTLTNAGDTALTNISIAQPDAVSYGEGLSLLLPNVKDTASIIYTRDVTAEEIAAGEVRSNAYVLAHARGQEVMEIVADILPLSDIKTYDTFATASITPASLPVLNVGQSFTFTAPYQVKQTDLDAGNIHNVATATALNLANQTLTQTASADVPLAPAPAIGVVKIGTLNLGADNIATVGDLITYEFDVTNLGNVTLTGITIADPLVPVAGGPLATLAPGVTNKVKFTATHALTQADINAGHFDNTATVSGKPPVGANVTAVSDFVDPTQHRPTVVTMVAQPAIALIKSVKRVNDVNGNGRNDVGDTISYAFSVKNTGNVTLKNVKVTDPLLPGAPNALSGGPIATLAPGAVDETTFTGTYTITLLDMNAGEVTNTATVTAQAPDGSTVQDASDPGVFTSNGPTIQPLAQVPKITLVKKFLNSTDTNGDGLLDTGDVIHYTFTIQNLGNVSLTNFKVVDLLPGASVIAGVPLTLLDPGQINTNSFTADYTVTGPDENAGQVSNQATVTADSPKAVAVSANSDSANPNAPNPAPTITPIVANPKIAIIKLPPTWTDNNIPGGDGLTDAGDTLSYQFKIKNTGNVDLHNVNVKDLMPGVTVSQPANFTLVAGAESTLDFTATHVLTSADISAGKFDNQARATGTTSSGKSAQDLSDPADYTKDAVTPFTFAVTPGIAVKKTFSKFTTAAGVSVTTPSTGDLIVYTIAVKNTGNADLNNIAIVDLNGTIVGGAPLTLIAGAENTTNFTATHVITNADFLAGGVTNQVSVSGTTVNTNVTVSDDSDPTSYAGNSPTFTKLVANPTLAVIKTDSVEDVNNNGYHDGNDIIHYTFTVTNTGNVELYDVTLTDANAVLTGGPIAHLAVGASDTLTYTATHLITRAQALSGSYSNQAVAVAAVTPGGAVAVTVNSDGTSLTGPRNPTVTPLEVAKPAFTKTASKAQVKRGEVVVYTITASTLDPGTYNILDIMPPGFAFVAGSATVNGVPAAPSMSLPNLMFSSLSPISSKITITLKMTASSTLSSGKFANNARLIDEASGSVLAVAQAVVEVVAEPVFDCSDIIGRVFDDENQNGYMDDGESGLPGVRLVTLNGVLITTDSEGRYHVPCAAIPDSAIGSNYLLKLDPRTLPTGYKLTTENPRDVRVTRGKATVLNFGAAIVHEVKVDVTGKAFVGDGIDLTPQWRTGITKLCKILARSPSDLVLVYHQGGETSDLAQSRIDGLAERVKQTCDSAYPIKTKTRVEEGK